MTNSSYSYTYAVETDATADAVWALYADASTWPAWTPRRSS